MSRPSGPLVRSISAALMVYLSATVIELAFIRAAAPTELELTWISDVVLAIAFGLAMYLWLHLKEARSELSHLEREQIVLDTQLAVAADIQKRFLPVLPEMLDGIGWAARLRGASQIGGDFYDFVQVDPNVVLMIVGDISGRGIPAALLLASTCTLFRMLVRETREPAQLLERLSAVLYADHGGEPYVTCIVCSFNLQSRTLTCANAGHPAGIVLGRAGRRTLAVGGVPAGMFPVSAYQSQTLPLEDGDVGIIMTDGVTEPIEWDGVRSADAIESAVAEIPRPIAPKLVCERVARLAEDRGRATNAEAEPDDRTVLAFVVHPPR
jgi:phosphoserine phosphatase RsbU/P